MTKLSFEDAVEELLGHMVNARPIDQELVMLKLSRAIANTRMPALKLVQETDKGNSGDDEDFDNMPI